MTAREALIQLSTTSLQQHQRGGDDPAFFKGLGVVLIVSLASVPLQRAAVVEPALQVFVYTVFAASGLGLAYTATSLYTAWADGRTWRRVVEAHLRLAALEAEEQRGDLLHEAEAKIRATKPWLTTIDRAGYWREHIDFRAAATLVGQMYYTRNWSREALVDTFLSCGQGHTIRITRERYDAFMDCYQDAGLLISRRQGTMGELANLTMSEAVEQLKRFLDGEPPY